MFSSVFERKRRISVAGGAHFFEVVGNIADYQRYVSRAMMLFAV
jgi:hypothetical protein